MDYFSVGAVVGSSPGDPSLAWFETPVVTFDQPNASFVTEADNVAHASILYSRSVPDVAAAPAGDTTTFEALQPGETATFTFGTHSSQIHTISVYIGSVDSYNKIQVLGSNGRVAGTITGADITQQYLTKADFGSALYWGDRGAWATNRRLYISDLPSDFTGLRFSSDGIAFEYDNIAVSDVSFNSPIGAHYTVLPELTPNAANVPETGTWSLMILGVALGGAGLRRRVRATA